MKNRTAMILVLVLVLAVLVPVAYAGDEPDEPTIDEVLRDARGSRVELVSDVYGIRVEGKLRSQPGGLWAVTTWRSRVLFYASDVAAITESDQDGIELRIVLARVGARP